MLAALILAAGDSTRMGSTKALLPDAEGQSFVVRLVRAFGSAGIANIVVVTGDAHEEIAAALGALPGEARAVRNDQPARGQLSSLWTGLDAVEHPGLRGVLVTPVDVPLVAESTIRKVVEVWQRDRAPIVRPARGGRHGHPVLFDRSVFDELRGASLDVGAKAVVRAHQAEIIDVQVGDDGCLVDVDTPDDYRRLFGR